MKWIKLYIYRKMSQHQQLPGNPHNIRSPHTTRVSGSQDPTLWEYQCKSFNILSHNIVMYFFLLNFVELGYLEHQWYSKYNGHITKSCTCTVDISNIKNLIEKIIYQREVKVPTPGSQCTIYNPQYLKFWDVSKLFLCLIEFKITRTHFIY